MARRNHPQKDTQRRSAYTQLEKHLKKLDQEARTVGLISLKEVKDAFKEIKNSRKCLWYPVA